MKGALIFLLLALGVASAQEQDTRPETYAKKIETSNEEVRGRQQIITHILIFLTPSYIYIMFFLYLKILD